MSDLAKDLLTQYYGLGAETSGVTFISIHQSVENVRKEEEEQVIEQTPFHEENVTAEESRKVIGDDENIDTTGEPIREPTEIFNNLHEYDQNGSLNVLNIDLGSNITCDIFECEPSTLREGFQHDIAQNTPRSTVDNPEMEAKDVKDFNENDVNLELIKDNNSNNDLEDPCYIPRKTPKSYHLKSLAPKKEPVCNQTFADFCNTGLKQFPNDILTSFPYLRMLYLSNNNLTELLDEIFSTLKYLEWLDVRNNEISFLPLVIKWHPCLETILLQGNKLESLPLELCTLPNLKTLQVTQNPLILPPEGIVASGSAATLEFLRIEWNNAHPEDRIEPKKNEIEPKLSTILCYQSPRKNKKKIMPLKNIYHNRVISTRERRKLYKPSNRYTVEKIAFFYDISYSLGKIYKYLCVSNTEKIIDSKWNQMFGNIQRGTKYTSLNISKNLNNSRDINMDSKIDEINDKFLRLMSLSPTQNFLRKNNKILRIYCKSREKKYTGSKKNEVIPVQIKNNIHFKEYNKKHRNDVDNFERVFNIVTNNGKKFQLNPMRLNNSNWMLSCLENYLGINK